MVLAEVQILVCRLIDRPVRPMIAHGYHRETQLLVWVKIKNSSFFYLLENSMPLTNLEKLERLFVYFVGRFSVRLL